MGAGRADEMTTREVAQRLGVSTATVVTYANDKKLTFRRLPSGHRRFDRDEIERFARKYDQAAS